MSLYAKMDCYLRPEPKEAYEALKKHGMDADLAFAVVEALCQGQDEALFELPQEDSYE